MRVGAVWSADEGVVGTGLGGCVWLRVGRRRGVRFLVFGARADKRTYFVVLLVASMWY